MKQVLRGLFYFSLLTAATSALACDSSGCDDLGSGDSSRNCCLENYNQNVYGNIYGMTNFNTHPVQWDAFRRMAGVSTERLHLFNQEAFYGTVSLALQYQQTSESNHLSQWFLFNDNNKNTMSYGANDDDTGAAFGSDINSYNFGVTSSGDVTFKPRIKNFIADIDLFTGWDQFVCGLWSRISIPINWTSWNMNLCDSNETAGAATFPEYLVTTDGSTPDVPYANLKQAWVGDKTFGLAPVMKYGKINGAQDTTQVAGLKLELGYDFIRKEDRHLAASFLVVAPTGNRSTAEYLFEPISGSNKQWEIGIDLNAHYNFWEREECNKSLGIHFDVALMGMTRSTQKRLFGLQAGGQTSPGGAQPYVISPSCATGAGASWLLLKEVDPDTGIFKTLQRASNILALDAKIGASFETNLGLMLKYVYNHFSTDFGYELYYRNAEKISDRTPIAANYGIMGGVKLEATINNTASTSTIAINGERNDDIVYITDANVCECTALHPAYSSSKLFSFYQYSWDNCDWSPTLGAGYSFEWSNKHAGIKNIAVAQWSALIKGSISF